MKALLKVNIIILLSACVVLPVCNSSGNISLASTPKQTHRPPTIPVPYKETILLRFDGGSGGANPVGVTQGSDGNFYGTTIDGGRYNHGTVYRITPQGQKTVLHSFFGGNDGALPYGITQGSDGNFYGITQEGGGANGYGTVFKITPQGQETVLHSFGIGKDGTPPQPGLIQGRDGNFYGITSDGGANGYGTVFKITPQGQETILYSFAGYDGAVPLTALILGSDGNFYGTTSKGGVEFNKSSNGCGTVYRITPQGQETILYSFAGGSDGATPLGLTQGRDGNFYGTTELGGASNGSGTVFKITPQGQKTLLYRFAGVKDGAPPIGITQGRDGNFYGTTVVGGGSTNCKYGCGTVYRVTPQGQKTIIHSFAGGTTDGALPYGRLIQGSDDYLYGTTTGAGELSVKHGVIGYGTVFKISIK